MATQTKDATYFQFIQAQKCFKTELSKLISKCLIAMSNYNNPDGLNKLDIDQGYQRQHDCDKYWHKKD